MPAKYAKHVSAKSTPQREPIPGKVMVENSAGGYVFEINDWAKLDRFLILGAEGGSYYADERKMTKDNATTVQGLLKVDGVRVVKRVVEISDAGRAPKNDPALFVLALAASSDDLAVRRAAYIALPKVARIGTHIFHYVDMVQSLRGWSRGLRRSVADWYNKQPIDKLALNLVKYQSRDGWSNRDLLRMAHPEPQTHAHDALYRWAVGKPADLEMQHPLVLAFEDLKRDPSVAKAVKYILDLRLPREALPTQLLNEIEVWDALLKDMPITAMIRNLGKMSSIGLLKPLSLGAQSVCAKLTNTKHIKGGRVHPIALMLALAQYVRGHGDKGSLTWTPVQQVADALDDGFYAAFETVEPTGKRIMLALDVSGSMGGGSIAGSGITPRAAAAAMALVTAATEKNHMIVGFSAGSGGWKSDSRGGAGYGYRAHDGITPLPITPKMRLDQAIHLTSRLDFGRTDCALPMLYATANKLTPEAFVIYTDNETYAGTPHPVQALQEYRRKSGINAKLVVVGMTATGFSIADPNDAGMLDVVGFDSATPQVIANFLRD